MHTKISVVILHYMDSEKTIKCTDSLLKGNKNISIYIVDNYSNNGSLELLQRKYEDNDNISFICLNHNLGFARANNLAMKSLYKLGIKHALVTNNDVIFLGDVVNELTLALEQTDNIIIAVPRVLSYKHEVEESVCLDADTMFTHFFKKISRRKINFAKKCRTTTQVKQFSGCCFACNLKLMHSINYFDSYTFLYFEEPIIEKKIEMKNLKIVYVPKAEIIHNHDAKKPISNKMILGYMLDSEIYYLRKYLSINVMVLEIYIYIKRFIHKLKYNSMDLYKYESDVLYKVKNNKYEKPKS